MIPFYLASTRQRNMSSLFEAVHVCASKEWTVLRGFKIILNLKGWLRINYYESVLYEIFACTLPTFYLLIYYF